MTPAVFERIVVSFFASDRAVAQVQRSLPSGGRSVAEEIAQDVCVRLLVTARNRAAAGGDFWMTNEDEANAYISRALRNGLNRELRGIITEADHRGPGTADLREVEAIGASLRTAAPSEAHGVMDDPHGVLDRVAVAFDEGVANGDWGDCPGCGPDPLRSILLGLVEEARDDLDGPGDEAGDAYDHVRGTDDTARAMYRALGRSRGQDQVLDEAGQVLAKQRRLLSRCRPCVERIFDAVVGWIVGTPADWSGTNPGGRRG